MIATLGRECHQWAVQSKIEAIISEISGSEDVIIFTDGSVKRGVKSGWAFSARVSGNVIAERTGAVDLTTSSMAMGVNAVREALM